MRPVRKNHVFAVYPRALAVALVCIAVMLLADAAWPYANMASQPIGGPWEIAVQSGGGDGLQFPVVVPDENKPTLLNNVFPVMGTSVKIKLEQYIPDLKWDTVTVEQPGGGVVAKLTVSGTGLNEEIWLNSDDLPKRSIVSSIGSVATRKLHSASTVEKMVHELTAPDAVGVVSVWSADSNTPTDYVVRKSGTIEASDSKYKLSILEYMPHYSLDTQTKKVANLSSEPVNPAIRVRLEEGKKSVERWLWSKFPSTPHMGKDRNDIELDFLPVFTCFDIARAPGRYIIVAASGSDAWILFHKDEKVQAEKIELNRPYPFASEAYFFSVNSIATDAVIKTDWKNNSEKLLRPALVAVLESGEAQQKVILELNKPYHYKTDSGTMIILYRPQVSSPQETGSGHID
jgi:hypothetical protein